MARAKGVYKRGDVWWIRYAGLDGKIRFESSRSASYKDAQAVLVERKKVIQEGKDPMPTRRIENHTFNELGEHYLKFCERQRSYYSKKKFMGALAKVFGNLPLKSFTTRLVDEWQSERLKKNKPATVNRHLEVLKHAFRKAFEWEMVHEEIFRKVARVRLVPDNNRRLRYLSIEECQCLIEACEPHLKPIVQIALNTGMRKGEILGLEWEKHIDLRHGFILLDITKNGERREIPMNTTVKETLRGLVRRLDSPYVLVDAEGRRFQNVKRSFASACRRAGIKDFRFHDLRHTFASQLVMEGIDITTVKELLGHKTLTMTLRYAHLAPSHKVKAVEVLYNSISVTPTIQKLYNWGGAQ